MVSTWCGEPNFIPFSSTVLKGGSAGSAARVRSAWCTVAVFPVPGVPERYSEVPSPPSIIAARRTEVTCAFTREFGPRPFGAHAGKPVARAPLHAPSRGTACARARHSGSISSLLLQNGRASGAGDAQRRHRARPGSTAPACVRLQPNCWHRRAAETRLFQGGTARDKRRCSPLRRCPTARSAASEAEHEAHKKDTEPHTSCTCAGCCSQCWYSSQFNT